MTISSIQLGLRIGSYVPDPAPAELMQALQRVEVTQTDSAPSGFQLAFHVDTSTGNGSAIVGNSLLAPFNRVIIRVSVDGAPMTLIDGYITHFQNMPGDAPGQSTLVVTGEDLTVAMDRIDYSREFPLLEDNAIVALVLAPYLLLGLVPDLSMAFDLVVPIDHVPQQAGTDRQTIQQLAQRNGYVFYVSPTSVPMVNTAHWGPPPRSGPVLAVLNASGPWSNVDSLQFEHDPLSATSYVGAVMDFEMEPNIPWPILTFTSTRVPPLASKPALSPLGLLSADVRKELWRQQELDPVAAQMTAQALTNLSTDSVVKATCEMSPTRVGAVVQAPGIVGVRNATPDYDGLYYLQSATHQISLGADNRWDYRQSLTLTREGVGTTTNVLEAS